MEDRGLNKPWNEKSSYEQAKTEAGEIIGGAVALVVKVVVWGFLAWMLLGLILIIAAGN